MFDVEYKTVAALLMEGWKRDMKEGIGRISWILPNTPAGNLYEAGGKTQAIQRWMSSVLTKYTHCKAEHRRYLNEAVATL